MRREILEAHLLHLADCIHFTWHSVGFSFISLVQEVFCVSVLIVVVLLRMEYGVVLMSLMLVIACYNGASFYIDVIGHKYYELKLNKND